MPVGLGVDGAASNEASSLLGEVTAATLFARGAGGPHAMTVREAVELGTLGGARLLGREAEIGSLEPGKLADVALWRLDGVPHAGIADPVAALVLGPPAAARAAARERPGGRRARPRGDRRRAAGGRRGRAGPRESPDDEAEGMTITPAERAGDGPAAPAAASGQPRRRPDATPKVTGQFAYGSDLWMDDMIWGVTLRSPHPHARIRSIAIGEALATGGVYAVLTHDDVPGRNVCGLELADQPVLADGVVRYEGEPVALVAADHPEIARQAAKKIAVDYEVLPPVTDARRALDPAAPRLHRGIPGATWSATSRSARATRSRPPTSW